MRKVCTVDNLIIFLWLSIAGLSSFLIGFLLTNPPASADFPPNKTSNHVDSYAKRLVQNMSIEEKVGMMTQVTVATILKPHSTVLNETKVREFAKMYVGSYLNSPFSGGPLGKKYGLKPKEWRQMIQKIQEIYKEMGRSPILYGIDSVHGAVYIEGATLFGHQINSAATFNPSLVHEIGRITGKDTLAAGIPWIFGPILGIATSDRWPRVFETFGEDPLLVSTMGYEIIRGIQSNKYVAACMKHFIAYSNPSSGHDRDNVVLSEFDLLNHYAPSFMAAVKAGVMSAMEAYISLNGQPVVSSHKILVDLLRKDMNFKGMLVTDWGEINNLYAFHKSASSKKRAAQLCLNKTSVDMSMVAVTPEFIPITLSLLKEGKVSEDRINESAERIMSLKLALNILNNPVPGEDLVNSVGSKEDQRVALQQAHESITLLKNDKNILPINADSPKTKILLTGPLANSIGYMCGGWTLDWQGIKENSAFPLGKSIKSSIEHHINISYAPGIEINGSFSSSSKELAIKYAKESTYVVVTLGEDVYAEKPGDLTSDFSLPQGQLDYIKDLYNVNKNIILILIQGRPRLLKGITKYAAAILYTYLPCEFGGIALANILLGKVNPSGKLPLTYPKNEASFDIPYFHKRSTMCSNLDECEMEWQFGEGLSYTTFEYSNFAVNETRISGSNAVEVSADVKNVGKMDGKEVVLVFVSQAFRESNEPEVKRLRAFKKITLNVGEKKRMSFSFTKHDFSYFLPQIGKGFKSVTDAGDYFISMKYDTKCNIYNSMTKKQNQGGGALCRKVSVKHVNKVNSVMMEK